MRSLAIVVLIAGCGSSAKPVHRSERTEQTEARLELAEISIAEGAVALLVHANGNVEFVEGADKKLLGTLAEDGTFTMSDGDAGRLQADGSFMTAKHGAAPFKLEGETLAVGTSRLTLDANNTIQGGAGDVSSVKITGVTTAGTRRTALLMIGFLTIAK